MSSVIGKEVMSVTHNILTLAIVVWYVRNVFDLLRWMLESAFVFDMYK